MWTIVIAIAVAGTAASISDWFFMGLLFHDAYNRYPEVWRISVRGGQNKSAILWSLALGYLMTAGMVGLCVLARVHSVSGGMIVGLVAAIAGPVVPTLINGLFIKIDPKISLAHALGYSARLILGGVAAGFALG